MQKEEKRGEEEEKEKRQEVEKKEEGKGWKEKSRNEGEEVWMAESYKSSGDEFRKPPENIKTKITQKLISITKDIAIAFLLALFVRTFIIQAYKIPTGSMVPTLLAGDYILVSRIAYGIRIPWKGYIIRWGEIKRGDVVVFVYPEDPSKDFIKRVIALPGEKVEIRKKKIYIDGKPIEDKWGYFSGEYIGPPRDDFGPIVVPKDHVFVMGDNRDESNDSRFWGTVPIENIKGKALIIYFSISPEDKRIRFERILTSIR